MKIWLTAIKKSMEHGMLERSVVEKAPSYFQNKILVFGKTRKNLLTAYILY